MFTNNKSTGNHQARKAPTAHDTAVTILTAGCHFDGKLYCRGSSRIGGRIEGEIISEGLLIIEEGAVITAKIQADEAIIQGNVRGQLTASGRVELAETSCFEGDIATPSLMVAEGAQFNGSSSMSSLGERDQRLLEPIDSQEAMSGPDATPSLTENGLDRHPEVAV